MFSFMVAIFVSVVNFFVTFRLWLFWCRRGRLEDSRMLLWRNR